VGFFPPRYMASPPLRAPILNRLRNFLVNNVTSPEVEVNLKFNICVPPTHKGVSNEYTCEVYLIIYYILVSVVLFKFQ
jgi:hypothetical protein